VPANPNLPLRGSDDTPPLTIDNSKMVEEDHRYRRKLALITTPPALVVAVLGGWVLFLVNRSPPGLPPRDNIVAIALIIIGGGFITINALGKLGVGALVARITIDDSGVIASLTTGVTKSVRWADPNVRISILYASRDRNGNPTNITGRILSWKGFSNAVPMEVAEAVVARARLRGLAVSVEQAGPLELTKIVAPSA
jgi:hypothetical protein